MIKRLILGSVAAIVAASSALAYGGYGMMGGGYGADPWTGGIVGVLMFSLASFLFGIIFWYTHKLVIGDHKKK